MTTTLALVSTLKDRCRMCFTCVRECPAKAIRIAGGQAEVIPNRCIACGNCIKVCSQDAKTYLSSVEAVTELLTSNQKVAALLAPSFPAEFVEYDNYKILVGKIRALGFSHVIEVATGADLVAKQYKHFLDNNCKSYISSDCPAIVSYIRLYYPNLVPSLIPVVSPMVATARIVKLLYGEIPTVFIGPCVAKKNESDEVTSKLTFRELRSMLQNVETAEASDFDPPFAGLGAIFPLSGGLMQAAGFEADIVHGDILIAEGRIRFQEAVKEFESGTLPGQHLELLCCDGCIMGPGTSPGGKHFARKLRISQYVRQKFENFNRDEWEQSMKMLAGIDLSTSFEPNDQRIARPASEEVEELMHTTGKALPNDQLNCGACGYDTCEEHAIAVLHGLAEPEMCLPYAIASLHKSIDELAVSNEKLFDVQQALKQSEKLAHMGQLSAGIAHELNNPLGVVIMYTNILLDECRESPQLQKDLQLIVEQATRCRKIVSGLLNFARRNQVNYSLCNLVGLAHQGLSSVIIPSNIQVRLDSNMSNPLVEVDSEQIIQVFSNLIKNGIEAMPLGGSLTIGLSDLPGEICCTISDNGEGIETTMLDKVFEPFFTTKAIGKGTGLGLATVYGIIKMHNGKIDVSSNADASKAPTGTRFCIVLPRKHISYDNQPPELL